VQGKMNIKNQKKALLLASFVLCAAVLALDLLGVKVIGQNGLGFKAHCYSYGSTFIAASAIFTWIFRVSSEKDDLKNQSLRGVIVGGVWWFFSFVSLLYFHGAIGGTM
jgi:hypothetical protein